MQIAKDDSMRRVENIEEETPGKSKENMKKLVKMQESEKHKIERLQEELKIAKLKEQELR